MPSTLPFDEDLARDLPLPLAKLYVRAHNTKTATDLHKSSFYLWEASLRLLAAACVACYAERPDPDPALEKALSKLARPTIGDAWGLISRLVPILADAGDAGFVAVREVLLGGARDDWPCAAELDAAIREVLGLDAGPKAHVRPNVLLDRLVKFRNRERGHGAVDNRSRDFHERMGHALWSGASELLGKLDFLAGRRLVYVEDVRLQKSGYHRVEWQALVGQFPKRLPPVERPASDAVSLPRPEQVYLLAMEDRPEGEEAPARRSLVCLRPLIVYDDRLFEVFFLNAPARGQSWNYLCFTTGENRDLNELEAEEGGLLARILGQTVDPAGSARWEEPDQEEDPVESPPVAATPLRRVGEFELLSILGRGNMGIVYRVWQRSLCRQVALKVIKPVEGVDEAKAKKAAARFRREIRALGRVDHPNLVKIYTSGFDGEMDYFTMELVEGASLAAVIESLSRRCAERSTTAAAVDLPTWHEALSTACDECRKSEKSLRTADEAVTGTPPVIGVRQASPLPELPASGPAYVHRVVELVRQVALAVHALHEAEVVHRDIKPGNIMVTADGAQAVLMDLGIAQVEDVEGDITKTREFLGTLRYASPEQVLSVGSLDRRSDIYSLGATLWELLTLRPLFGATEQTPPAVLMQQITLRDPERVREYHPGIAADLETIVQKCLEKDAAQRYTTAAELAEDLGRWLRGDAVMAQPPTFGYLVGRFARRHRVPIALASFFLATWLIGAPIVAVLFYIEGIKEKDLRLRAERAEVREKVLRHRAEQAEVIATDAVDQFFTSVSESELISVPNMEPLRKKFLALSIAHLKELQKQQGAGPRIKARIAQAHFYVGRMHERLGQYDDAVKEYQTAMKDQVELLEADPKNSYLRCDCAETEARLGLCYFRRTETKDQARKTVEEARDVLLAAREGRTDVPDPARPGPPELGDDTLNFELARIYHALGYLVKQIDEQADGGPGPVVGSHPSAREDLENAKVILDRLIAPTKGGGSRRLVYEHRRALVILALANLDRDEGRADASGLSYRDAADFWRGRLDLAAKKTEARPPDVAEHFGYRWNLVLTLTNLVALETARGRLAEAEELGKRSRKAGEDLVADFRYEDCKNALGKDHLTRGFLHLNQLWRAERRGDRAEAARWADQVGKDSEDGRKIFADLDREKPGTKPYLDGRGLSGLLLAARFVSAEPRAARGDVESAQGQLNEALKIYKGLNSAGGPQNPDFQARLATTWRLLGDARTALATDDRERGDAASAAGWEAEADSAYREACAIADHLIENHKQILFASQAGQHYCHAARFLNQAHDLKRGGKVVASDKRASEASALAERSIRVLSEILRRDGTDDRARLYLIYAYAERALARARLGDGRRAAADADVALREAKNRADALHGQDAERPFPLLYGLAATYARAALAPGGDEPGAATRADAAASYADEALKLLDDARERGLFADIARRDRLANDPDFQALRSLDRFRRIVAIAGPTSRGSTP